MDGIAAKALSSLELMIIFALLLHLSDHEDFCVHPNSSRTVNLFLEKVYILKYQNNILHIFHLSLGTAVPQETYTK